MKTMYKFVACLMLLVAVSCKETEEIQPIPAPPADGGKTPVQLFTLSVKPATLPVASVFTAVISAVKEDGTPLYTDANLAFTLTDGVLVSNKIELPAGHYKLTKLLIKDEKKNVVIASPLVNSAKATGTVKALPLAFTEAPLVIESASVNETDLPEEYGYEANAFGETPYIKIKLKSIVYIRGVEYRPATTIKITSGSWTKEVQNNSEVLLPRKLETFHFESNVWTLHSAKTVTLTELKTNSRVVLEASSVAKLLKEQLVYSPAAAGGSVVSSKTHYTYLESGQLNKIFYYQKKVSSDELELQTIHEFNYSNGTLVLIKRSNGKNENIGFSTFSYDPQGRIAYIDDKKYDTHITGTFTYPLSGKTEGHYTFDNGNTMTYQMTYSELNKIEDVAYGTGSESGKYVYDDQINPFYFMNYSDLLFSNTSKNNRLNEEKSYGGIIPSLELYKSEYSYDAQGYPEMLIRSYRGYTSKQHLFTDTIEYSYY